MITISILGLIVNLVGLLFFHEHAHFGFSSNSSQATSSLNLRGVFLHIFADALSSLAVIVSSICIQYLGLQIADPICCFIIASLIIFFAVPLLQDTFMLLVLGSDGQLSS